MKRHIPGRHRLAGSDLLSRSIQDAVVKLCFSFIGQLCTPLIELIEKIVGQHLRQFRIRIQQCSMRTPVGHIIQQRK